MEHAKTFLDIANQYYIDPSIGFLLQLPRAITSSNKASKDLMEFLDTHGIEWNSRAFQEGLQTHVDFKNIQEITPKDYVASLKKKDAIEAYRAKSEKWGIHNPFFFQTTGKSFKESIFFIFRTWPDGVRRLLEMLNAGFYMFSDSKHPQRQVNVCYAIEHVLDESTIFSAIIDCDQKLSRFSGRVNEEQLKENMLRLPEALSNKLVGSEMLDEETFVESLVKDRCRQIKDKEGKSDMKMSFHFATNLTAQKRHHQFAFSRAINGSLQWIKDANTDIETTGVYKLDNNSLFETRIEAQIEAQIEGEAKLKEEYTWLSYDLSATPGGSNGISTAFALKKPSDPYPTIRSTSLVCSGVQISNTTYPISAPHDLSGENLNDQERFRILAETCYTIPKRTAVTFSDFVLTNAKQEAIKVLIYFILFYFISFHFIQFHFIPCSRRESNPLFHTSDLSLKRWGTVLGRRLFPVPATALIVQTKPICQNGSSQFSRSATNWTRLANSMLRPTTAPLISGKGLSQRNSKRQLWWSFATLSVPRR